MFSDDAGTACSPPGPFARNSTSWPEPRVVSPATFDDRPHGGSRGETTTSYDSFRLRDRMDRLAHRRRSMRVPSVSKRGSSLVNVLLLSEFYPPEPNSAALKMADLARSLTSHGHQVTVVTGFPNYPDGVLHAGYRRSWCER